MEKYILFAGTFLTQFRLIDGLSIILLGIMAITVVVGGVRKSKAL